MLTQWVYIATAGLWLGEQGHPSKTQQLPITWKRWPFLQVKVTSGMSKQWFWSKIVLHLKTKFDKNNAGYLFSTACSERIVVLWRTSTGYLQFQCNSQCKYPSSLGNMNVFWTYGPPLCIRSWSSITDLGLCVKGRADLPKEHFLPKYTTTAEAFTSLVIKESLTSSSNPAYHPQLELLRKKI